MKLASVVFKTTVEFQVGKSKFGIGIQHVREIIQPVPVFLLPHSHPNL